MRSPEAIAAASLTAVTTLPSPSQNSALSRRHAKHPYSRIVFIGPKGLVVNGPVLLDPLSVVDHFRVAGDRYIFLALVVRQSETNRLVAPDFFSLRSLRVGEEIDEAFVFRGTDRHWTRAHNLSVAFVGDDHGDRNVMDQLPHMLDIRRFVSHGFSLICQGGGTERLRPFRYLRLPLSFCWPSTGRRT